MPATYLKFFIYMHVLTMLQIKILIIHHHFILSIIAKETAFQEQIAQVKMIVLTTTAVQML
jgi:hypothetical protein